MLSAHVYKIEIDMANCFIPMDSKSLFHVTSGILWEHVWLSKHKIQKIVNRVIAGLTMKQKDGLTTLKSHQFIYLTNIWSYIFNYS